MKIYKIVSNERYRKEDQKLLNSSSSNLKKSRNLLIRIIPKISDSGNS